MIPVKKYPSSLPERRRAAYIKSVEKRRGLALVGKLACLCSEPAHRLSSSGPVCLRCDTIEAKLSRSYAKEFSGSNRRGDNIAGAMMPYAVHCPVH